jgi:lipoprotein-anchoring transpeptidase ErfK/SrfK
MRKVLYHLASITFLLLLSTAPSLAAPVCDEQPTDDILVAKLVSIREKMHKTDKPLFFMRVDVQHSIMTVYRLDEEVGEDFSLERMRTYSVGTPRSKKYPKGLGIITAIERFPIWAPTPETVTQFKKRGIELEKFRNAQGKIIIPAGHHLNYMGPVKMKIKFLEKQADPRFDRDVYRIHGTLKKDERRLGTRCSGGCIRTKNDDLIELDDKIKGGFIVVEYV